MTYGEGPYDDTSGGEPYDDTFGEHTTSTQRRLVGLAILIRLAGLGLIGVGVARRSVPAFVAGGVLFFVGD